jgi:transcriptional regulator with XRE-family HTH domain
MGRYARRKPARLSEKLLQIRDALALSQDGMLTRLGLDQERFRSSVSSFERGGEPELHVLLRYARLVNVPVEVLIDDKLDLPKDVQRAARRGASLRESKRRKQKE